jgi:nucleoid DNA-binding protein
MRQRYILASGIMLGSLGLLIGLSAPAQFKPVPKEPTLAQRLAATAKLSEDDANRFLQALGTAVRDELKRGKEVSLAGLGRFRVVQVQEHRDLVDGRPAIIPATNRVEFIATDLVDAAANSAGAKPAETVVPFHYIPLPGQAPSQRVPTLPILRTRIK